MVIYNDGSFLKASGALLSIIGQHIRNDSSYKEGNILTVTLSLMDALFYGVFIEYAKDLMVHCSYLEKIPTILLRHVLKHLHEHYAKLWSMICGGWGVFQGVLERRKYCCLRFQFEFYFDSA